VLRNDRKREKSIPAIPENPMIHPKSRFLSISDPSMICVRMLAFAGVAVFALPAGAQEVRKPTWEEYLRNAAVPRAALEAFSDPDEISWAKFHPVLGYTLGNSMPRDGIDGSSTISTAVPGGIRTARMYTEKPCRINTYGNSYTQCHQVSDGETWQEYLAAHLGEPVRNFGMGGYGTYQAYRRMLFHEATGDGAEYLILYLYGDDHIRSLLPARYAWSYPTNASSRNNRNFHGNFWPHIALDMETGEFVEYENPLNTREKLMKMADPEFMYQALRDDLALQIYCFSRGSIDEIDMARVRKLADKLGVKIGAYKTIAEQRVALRKFINTYGYRSTMFVLRKARAFAEANNKKLMIVNFDPWKSMGQVCRGEPRDDQELVDFINAGKFLCFDMNLVHAGDFKQFNISYDDYFKRYFHGHYNPTGNHFFAYTIKNLLVEWLNPKPITYQNTEEHQPLYDEYFRR
jgi:hypothetical protein